MNTRRCSSPSRHCAAERFPRVRGLLALLACGLLALPRQAIAAADEQAAPKAKPAILQLSNGDVATGQLVDSDDGTHVLWKSPAFADDLSFPIGAVQAIQFPVSGELSRPEADYCFELAAGDVLFGSLISLDADKAELDVLELGRLHLDRAILRRMYRWNKNDSVFLGLSSLDAWEGHQNVKAWREEAGQLVCSQDNAVIWRDFGIPPQARFEIELSWSKKPDFELALGVSADTKSAARAFRFEVWDDQLVALRETEGEADVAALQTFAPGPGRVSLQAYVDQERGRMLVFSPSGKQLAELVARPSKPKALGGLQIGNRHGDLKLESLRIGKWNGETPLAVDADKARILKTDGTIAYGQLKSYDRAARSFLADVAAAETPIGEDAIQDVVFAHSGGTPPRALRALHFSGLRTSGDLLKIEANRIWLKCPGVEESFSLPIDHLQSLAILDPKADVPALPGRQGRLELQGTTLTGCLVDGHETDASCLVWRPIHSEKASRLARGVSARIVYREGPPQPTATKPAASAPVVRRFAFGEAVFRQLKGSASPNRPQSPSKSKATTPILHLRSGDTIPCVVTHIDEKGISFESALTEGKFVAHEQVKALELMPEATPAKIARPKKERLLTLPRMQRDSPPTQLIRSADGDYLRGRLVSMDKDELQVEVRLETRSIPLKNVARIIWLHADEMDPAASAAAPEHPQGTRVQVIPSDENRLTFIAERFQDSTLSGRSDLLGVCRVDLANVNQLLLGGTIEETAAGLAFHQWKLKPAAEPLTPSEEGSDADVEGLESALVGKPAPDFRIDLLDGKKFRLADRKDKILILDFWASWCGPCLQVMPQVDAVAREFADRDVELIAVNLEETAERVKAALERLGLTMTVALDRDGRVAEKYGATSIPQTVIIGRDGKVARLYVGGGARFDEQLRAALNSILEPAVEKTD
jgi:thiol-disulfide isomerase/thioredoxin